MDISFYQFSHQPLNQVLLKLLEKIIETGKRSVVLCESEEQVQAINQALWTASQMSFLPHGCRFDSGDLASEQPVWITDHLENPNQSEVLVVISGQKMDDFPQGIKRLVDLFDHLPESIEKAKVRYQAYQILYPCRWFEQTADRGWITKAV